MKQWSGGAIPNPPSLRTLCVGLDFLCASSSRGKRATRSIRLLEQGVLRIDRHQRALIESLSTRATIRLSLTYGDVSYPPEGSAETVSVTPCVIENVNGPRKSGVAFRRADGLMLVLLTKPMDPLRDEAKTEKSGTVSSEEARFRRLFHDVVSPTLIAASFAASFAKEDLVQKGVAEIEELEQVGRLIDLAVQELINAFPDRAV